MVENQVHEASANGLDARRIACVAEASGAEAKAAAVVD